jgi:hypothetical protein
MPHALVRPDMLYAVDALVVVRHQDFVERGLPVENPGATVELAQMDGLNTAETAECLGVSEDVVKTWLSRGRAALRNLLAERAGILAPEAFRFPQPRCDRGVTAVFARIS